jgi:hypothetical protein
MCLKTLLILRERWNKEIIFENKFFFRQLNRHFERQTAIDGCVWVDFADTEVEVIVN